MRSSKSRSRSKSNRNRSVGNIVNRVFDSSGPEGKVRGTPQQIIEKYSQLARDAQLGNDRVAFENFQQHAEHYTRMLAEAQREQDARREQEQHQHRDRPQGRQDDGPEFERRDDRPQQINGHDNGDRQQAERGQQDETHRDDNGRDDAQRNESQRSEAQRNEPQDAGRSSPQRGRSEASDVIDTGADGDSTLVETPESRPARPRRRRRVQPEAQAEEAADNRETDETESAK